MKKINFYPILSALFVGGMALSAVSCADNNLDEENNGGEQELAVKFNVSDAQDEPTTNSTSTTRGVTASGVSLADLKGQTLELKAQKTLMCASLKPLLRALTLFKSQWQHVPTSSI